LSVLASLVDRAEVAGVPRSQIVLLGFSQGACLTAEFSIRHASRFGALAILSGGAIGPPGTIWEFEGRFDGTPVFLGCSDHDAHVPESRVRETADVFSRMGANVIEEIYPGMDHTVSADEIACVQSMIDAIG